MYLHKFSFKVVTDISYFGLGRWNSDVAISVFAKVAVTHPYIQISKYPYIHIISYHNIIYPSLSLSLSLSIYIWKVKLNANTEPHRTLFLPRGGFRDLPRVFRGSSAVLQKWTSARFTKFILIFMNKSIHMNSHKKGHWWPEDSYIHGQSAHEQLSWAHKSFKCLSDTLRRSPEKIPWEGPLQILGRSPEKIPWAGTSRREDHRT